MQEISIIVPGALHTDIIATGIRQFPQPGELVYGDKLVIGPGGKSRNMAAMMATLLPQNRVAMIGRTSQDPYGLWKVPVDACKAVGINMDFVTISSYEETGKFPGTALIPVDANGNNQIIVLRGAAADFSPDDVETASELFAAASANNGYLVLSLECPLETVLHAAEKARNMNIRVMLDPGGLTDEIDIDELLQKGLYLIKPNQHETRMLTGIEVTDEQSAGEAAAKLREKGAENVVITAGGDGAYLFTTSGQKHIPIPDLQLDDTRDETGCGDQTMSALCAFLQMGKSLEEAVELAVVAGTLQFHRVGIQPVTTTDVEQALNQE